MSLDTNLLKNCTGLLRIAGYTLSGERINNAYLSPGHNSM